MTRNEIEHKIVDFARKKQDWFVYTQVERWLDWQVDVTELWEILNDLVQHKFLKQTYKQWGVPQFRATP